MLRQVFASGVLPVDKEVDMRVGLADILMQEYERSRSQQDLRDAIDHNETILRRLPSSSPVRPERLDLLSYAYMSEYAISNSRRALDEAVRNGRLARDEAVIAGLPERNMQSYLSILNNVGYALSHRNGAVESATDLDEAIECAREIRRLAPRNGTEYSRNIVNLVSRLRARYRKRDSPADREEAMELITEQRSTSSPGTMEHGIAVIQLGEMAVERFERTDAIEDLDEALGQLKAGLTTLPPNYEKRFELESRLSKLYSSRHKKSNDFEDIRSAMVHSDSTVEALPLSNPIRGFYLAELMRCFRDFVNATTAIVDVDRAISIGKRRLEEMPIDNPKRHSCRWAFSDVLGRKYILTRTLESLVETLDFNEKLCIEYNARIEMSGSMPPVDPSLMFDFKENVTRLSHIRVSEARNAATTRLYELISSACKSKDMTNALLDVQRRDGKQLVVYIDAAESEEMLSNEEVQRKASELELAQTELRKRTSEDQWRPEEYHTELDLRALAIDPSTKKIFVDFNIMEDILGYDPKEQVTGVQFVEREARMENETFEKAKAEGKHPNPRICRMCRYVKLLQPNKDVDGFMWEPVVKYIPFGNWAQLRCRNSCSICRLLLSCITGDKFTNKLHPRLVAIDPEVAGTSFELARLSTDETILKIEYGMLFVGELRIITPYNYTLALRQGWEVREQYPEVQKMLERKHGPLCAMGGQQVDLIQLERWLNNCDHNHGSVCNSYRGSGPRYSADIIMIVIDVVDNCLVQTTSTSKYFTLSYVWGAAEMSKTLRINYAARLQKGGLRESLPATIADAIALVRSLGERYLWVDALCIVQDDETAMQHDIKQMDIIYGKAFATIVAVHGTSAEAGLSGVNSTSRPLQQIESVTISGRSKDLEFDSDKKDQETVHMVASPMPLHLALEVSTLDTRGWVLQEQLLSRRCLYFTNDYLYFQCGREVLDECDSTECAPSTIIDNPLFNLQELVDLEPETGLFKTFTAYAKLVEKYTLRKLSYESDILNAFSGLFAVLNEYFQSDIISGIPASALDLALLWAPAAKLLCRECRLPTIEEIDMGQVDRNLPSWSWAGWRGPVNYRLFAETTAEESLPTPLAKSYTINVNGKLQTIPARSSGQGTHSSSTSGTPDSATASHLAEIATPTPTPSLLSNILQFTAPCVPLTAFTIPQEREYLSRQEHIHSTGSQSVRHILDPSGKRCGLWWEPAGYVYVGRNMSAAAESKMQFVGISQHGDTFRPRKGPNRVEGEIRMFDKAQYPSVGKGSGLVNVLAVDFNVGHDYAARITVARIHVKAWEEAGPVNRLVQLV